MSIPEAQRLGSHTMESEVSTALASLKLDPEAAAKHEAEGNWAELAKIYETALRAGRRTAEVPILVELGRVYWKGLGALEQAEPAYRKLRKLQPSSPAVLDFYREFHLSRNEVPQLLAMLAQAQRSETDPDARLRLGVEQAELAESRLGSIEKAIDLWKALLKQRPGHPEAVQALRRLFIKGERWNALLELLKEELERLPPDDADARVALHLEMVPIYRDRMRLDVMVSNTYAAVLALRPGHLESLHALAAWHESKSRWNDLVQILSRWADAVPAEEQVGILRRIATVQAEKLGKPQSAAAALERVLALRPDDAAAETTLIELYTKARSWKPLIDLHRRQLRHMPVDAQLARLGDMAKLAADKLGDPKLAIGIWNEVLERSPSDGAALSALLALYEADKRPAAVAEVLRRMAAREPDAAAKAVLLERRGMLLADKLGAGEAAIADLEAVEKLQPDNARVLRALRELYGKRATETGDFGALEALFARRNAHDELYDVLWELAERNQDTGLRVRLLTRAAEIAGGQLAQPEKAVKAFERILALQPGDAASARLLVGLYRGTERWNRLLATLEGLLAGDLPASERRAILDEGRRVCEEKLGSKTLAFQWCARAFELAPDDAALFAELERLGREADEWQALAGIYEKQLATEPGREQRVALLRRALEIETTRLQRRPRARAIAEELIKLVPDDPQAETALQAVFTVEEKWPDLLALMHARADRSTDKAAKLELLLTAARLEEERLEDQAAAARTYRQALQADGGNRKVLTALARLSEALGDRRGLADVVQRQIELASPGEQVTLLLRLGALHESLDDAPSALTSYLQVLDADAVSSDAVSGLERLLDAGKVPPDQAASLAARLAPYYEMNENFERWAKVLEVQAAAATDVERRGHLEVVSGLYAGPLADPGRAFDATLRLFELAPTDAGIREKLVERARAGSQAPALVAALNTTLQGARDVGLRRDLLLHVAELEAGLPGRTDAAEQAYREVLSIDPLHIGAFRALTQMLQDAERWEDLRKQVVARSEQVADAKEKLALLGQIAEIDEALIGDPARAIETHRRLLGLDPTLRASYRALERLYAATNQWRELEALLAKEAAVFGGNEALALRLRRAEVLVERLASPAEALEALETLAAEAPRDPDVRRLLEVLLASPEAETKAAALLEPLYEAASEWGKLVRVLEVEEKARTGGELGALLARIADIQEHRLESKALALGTWRRLLNVDPENGSALAEYERLATVLDRHRDLLELYGELAERKDAADVGGKADLLTRGARVAAGPLGDRDRAVELHRQIVALDPDNVETARPAARALESLYAEVGNNRGLVDVLRLQAGWVEDGRTRSALLLRTAVIEEEALGHLEGAATTLRSVLDIEPEHAEAIARLERILAVTSRHRDRVEVLVRRVSSAPDAATRNTLRWQIVRILDNDLGDLDGAIEVVREIADEDADALGPLEALDQLYARKDAHIERLEVLERSLALSQDDHDRIEFLLRTGELLAGPLGRPSEALDRWTALLALRPGEARAVASIELLLAEDRAVRLAAAMALQPVFEAGRDWKRLARVLVVFADEEDDRRERLHHRLRLASVLEERLGNPFEAHAVYGQAVHDAIGEPEMPQLLDAFERLSAQLGRNAELRQLYREIEPDLLDEGVRLRVQRTLAIESARSGDREGAAGIFRKILDQVPDDSLALMALDRLYRRQADDASLFDILLRRADAASGRDPKAELTLRLEAGALADKLGRPEDAISEYERAVELDAGSAPAIEALGRLYQASERWADLADLLSKQLDQGVDGRLETAHAIALHERLAHLQAEQLLNRDRAVAHLSNILQLDAKHAGAIAMLEAFLAEPEMVGAAADLLEPVYVRQSAWTKLVDLDELRRGQIESPERRIVWTRRIARIYEEQVEDLDKAFEWYGKVFREAPTDEDVRDQLLRLAPKLGRWKDLADLLAEYLDDELSDSPAVLEIVRLAATIYDEQVGDRDSARKLYRRYAEAQPDDAGASAVFERALERWESWAEQRDLLEEQATRAASSDARIALLRRSARLAEERLANRDQATATLRALLDERPGDRPANAELERLLALDEKWSDLADHLMTVAQHETDPAARMGAVFRLGALQHDRLDNVEAAIDRYGEVLAEQQSHPGARQRLESLLDHAHLRERAARLLEPVYREQKGWTELVRVQEILLETTDSAVERILILRDIAAIEERLGQPELALEAKGRAFLEDPADPTSLSDVEASAKAARRYDRLVQILGEGAERAGDADIRALIWGKAAAVWELGLGDPAHAVDAWRSALNARPDLEEAFVALERLLGGLGRTTDLVDVLEQHLEVAGDGGTRKMLAKRAAGLYEESLHDRDRAITAWKIAIEVDDSDEAALDALVRLYTATEAWRDLADIFQRKIELAKDAPKVRLLRFALAGLYDERLTEPSEAVSQLRAVLDDHPDDREALETLDQIFTREGQSVDLLEVLDRRVRVESNAADRDALALRAAKLVADDQGDVAGALERYREILERSPRDPGARAAVWEMARGDAERAGAVATLEPILRKGNEWSDLVDLLELKVEAVDAPAERLAVLAEVAQLEEERRNDTERAMDAWARAFAEDPHDARARTALERLAKLRQAEARLAEVYEERVGATYDADLQRGLLLRLADLYDGPLGQTERALASLRTAAEIPGDEGTVLARLEALLRKLGRDDELAEVLGRQAEVTNDVGEQARHLTALGELRAGKLRDPRGAVEAFRSALDRVPTLEPALAALRSMLTPAAGSGTAQPGTAAAPAEISTDVRTDVLEVLEPLAEQRDDAPELVRLYELRAELETDPDSRAGWLRRAAVLVETRLSDRARALRLFGAALESEPGSEEGADELERVANAAQAHEEGARAFEAALTRAEGRTAGDLALRAAKLFEASAPRAGSSAMDRAERLYLRVLEEDAESEGALEALERLYRSREGREATSKLARILERRAGASMDPAQRTAWQLEAARLLEKAGDRSAAITAFEAAREAEEGNADALTSLARLYEQDRRFPELSTILEEQARYADGPGEQDTRVSLYVRLGALRLEELGDADGAALALREALDVAPGHSGALEALAALELGRGDFSAYEEVLLQQLQAAPAAEQADVLFKLAKNALDRLDDRERGSGYLRQVIDAEPSNRRAWAELEALLAASERWHDLLDLLEQRATRDAADGRKADARRARLSMVDIWLKHLDSPDSARELIGEILAEEPLFVPALLALADIEEREDHKDEALEILNKASGAVGSGKEAADIEFRMARLLGDKGASDEEVEARLLAAIERDPQHVEALTALEGRARRAGNHGRLVQLLELRERIAGPEAKRALLTEIAALYSGPLDEPVGAVDSLRALVALAPDDLDAQENFGRALLADPKDAARKAEGEGVLTALLAKLTTGRPGKAAARIHLALGRLAEERGDLKTAGERYQAAYQIDPSQPQLLAALGRVAEAQNDAEKAKRFYRTLLLQSFDEAAVGVRKVDVYVALGRLHLASGEIPKARNMLERGLETSPGRDDIKQLLAGLPR